jgi:hypothetical protein
MREDEVAKYKTEWEYRRSDETQVALNHQMITYTFFLFKWEQ